MKAHEQAEAAADWLRRWYADHPIARDWEVNRVDARKGDVYVTLRIPDPEANAFNPSQREQQQERDGELRAIVCPARSEAVWGKLPKGGTVVIGVAIASTGEILGSVDCAHSGS
jgi:hypothetical protein